MLGQAETPLRLSQAATLGDQLLVLSAPEPFPMRLSYLETQIKVLSGRTAALEARTLPARWARFMAHLAYRRELVEIRLASFWRYVRMRWR